MPALLDFSISFVVNDTAALEVDPAPAPSLCLRKQCVGVAGQYIGWLDGKERREHTKSMIVVLSMNDFDEQPNKKEQNTPQASPVPASLRPEHRMPGAKQTNCFRFPPLRCLKL